MGHLLGSCSVAITDNKRKLNIAMDKSDMEGLMIKICEVHMLASGAVD